MCDASRGVVNKTNAASECAGAARSFFQSASPQGRTAVSRTVLTERTVRAVSDHAAGISDWIEGDVLRRYVALFILFFPTQGGKCWSIRT